MTLPADIAALIDAYAHAERTNLWNEGSPFPTPGFVNMVPETRAALESAIAELAADRDRYRDALVARHGGEPLALLSELDAARAERDAARQELNELDIYLRCQGTQGESVLDRAKRIVANTSLPGYVRLVEERDAARRDLESLTAAAKSLTEDPNACWEDFLAAVDAIARAQPEQPQQPKEADHG